MDFQHARLRQRHQAVEVLDRDDLPPFLSMTVRRFLSSMPADACF